MPHPELPLLHREITAWYASNARQLPWREESATPWAVMVSEFMLQQTPVVRVLPVWEAWMKRWPTPAALAADPVGEAVKAWGRLGYPRRALRLHAAALVIRLHAPNGQVAVLRLGRDTLGSVRRIDETDDGAVGVRGDDEPGGVEVDVQQDVFSKAFRGDGVAWHGGLGEVRQVLEVARAEAAVDDTHASRAMNGKLVVARATA